MKQTIKLNESQLRQIVKESIKQVLKEDEFFKSRHRMAPDSNVYYGEDPMGFFATDYLTKTFRRFGKEEWAKEFAEELYQREQQRNKEWRKGLVNP